MKAILLLLAASALQARDWSVIDGAFAAELAAQKIPGGAIVVVERGVAVLVRGHGVRSVEDPVAVNERTLFRLGSTAKVFTALAALRLAEEKRLDLQAPIGEHAVFGAVTMHQLLSHTAGLADEAPQYGPLDEAAMEANVRGYSADLRLATPGRLFSYANTGYVLAGQVIARVTGKPFAAAMQELVFARYGMKTSTYRPLEAILHPLALPHDGAGKVIRPFPEHAGAYPPGSLFATAEDLAQMLSHGLPETITTPRARIEGSGAQYGYGVIVEEGRVYHTGGRLGYGSRFEIYPAQGVAVFLMGNRTGALFAKTAQLLRNELGVKAASKPETGVPVAEEEAGALAGVYLNRGAIRAELLMAEGTLFLRAGARQIRVVREAGSTYRAAGGAQLERFRILRDAQGRPEYLCAEVWCLKKQ